MVLNFSNSQQKKWISAFSKITLLLLLEQFKNVSCHTFLPKIIIYVLRFIKSLLSFCSMLQDIFAAVTSVLDFIFSVIQDLTNMFSRPREQSMCVCAPMGTDFGKEMNNWPTSVSATSLWLTCSHAAAFYRLSPDATFFVKWGTL